MGRLSGWRYRDVTKRLRRLGFEFERHGAGSHEIWKHRDGERRVLIANHPRDYAEGTMRSMIRQSGVPLDDFLSD
jgi:predicted RNA binding protein YcfA (HicA-like mRNA interferase family)